MVQDHITSEDAWRLRVNPATLVCSVASLIGKMPNENLRDWIKAHEVRHTYVDGPDREPRLIASEFVGISTDSEIALYRSDASGGRYFSPDEADAALASGEWVRAAGIKWDVTHDAAVKRINGNKRLTEAGTR